MDTFRVDGKNYQMCDNGNFRVQVGYRRGSSNRRAVYKVVFKMEGIAALPDAIKYYGNYVLKEGEVKRFSCNTSRNALYYELHKVYG